MIMLQCSTRRACGTGHQEKHFEMITASDRRVTSLPSCSFSIYMHTVLVYVRVQLVSQCIKICVLYIECVSLPACVYQNVWMCAWYGWQACALWSSLLRAITEQRVFTLKKIAVLPQWQLNGRNKTTFNEDTHFTNITQRSEIWIKNISINQMKMHHLREDMV